MILDEDGGCVIRDMSDRRPAESEPARVLEERRVAYALAMAGLPVPAPNGYRDTWCGQVLADRVDGPCVSPAGSIGVATTGA